ncbi:MAG: phosphatidylglycerophosphatase A [Mariprofundaceae bacterium]|nr:phosphatidylglycerophosphatase A [Mariprofundaceae bacterium]
MIISQQWLKFFLAGFGSGWPRFAPGTWGSIAAWIIGISLLLTAHTIILLSLFILLIPLACWATYHYLPTDEHNDPGWIVIDEWLGQWLCMLIPSYLFEPNIIWLFACLIAFRILDIFKPWPISWAESYGPAWWSIHADDLLAGLFGGFMVFLGWLYAS